MYNQCFSQSIGQSIHPTQKPQPNRTHELRLMVLIISNFIHKGKRRVPSFRIPPTARLPFISCEKKANGSIFIAPYAEPIYRLASTYSTDSDHNQLSLVTVLQLSRSIYIPLFQGIIQHLQCLTPVFAVLKLEITSHDVLTLSSALFSSFVMLYSAKRM